MRAARTYILGLLIVSLAALTGCIRIWNIEGEITAGVPDLNLLEMPPYNDTETSPGEIDTAAYGLLKVDLWLDASQVMGGINSCDADSIYRRTQRNIFREGGFHYRFDNVTGWYQNVLVHMLTAADEENNTRASVRILRAGNERLSDAFLISQNLVGAGAPRERFASVRRDMLTYALDPMPTVIHGMSAEDMRNSFYMLGSPSLNQLKALPPDITVDLENPSLTQAMSDALDAQISLIQSGSAEEYGLVAQITREDNECVLLYALDNMDWERLNVIPFDPAGLRRMSGTDGVRYVESLLREKGVFNKGLCIGLYAFQLDYMGQLGTIGPANLAEPLIWGKPTLKRGTQTGEIDYIAAMPRVLLALVIGPEEQVSGYMGRLTRLLEADPNLKDAEETRRGPRNKDDFRYRVNGKEEPAGLFAFRMWETTFIRPKLGFYSQVCAESSLELVSLLGFMAEDDGFRTVTLQPDEHGTLRDGEMILRIPLKLPEGATHFDLSHYSQPWLEVPSTLLLEKTVQQTPDDALLESGAEQVISFRGQWYIFAFQNDPYALNEDQTPFVLSGRAELHEGGAELICTIQIQAALLKEGYYRLKICSDTTGGEISLEGVDWIDGDHSISAAMTNNDIILWETFTQAVAEKERPLKRLPSAFRYVWGPEGRDTYQGQAIPDSPPLHRAIGLSELANQIREAAMAQQVPYVRYVFDVFVSNRTPDGTI